jgi:hypothetical protein
MDEIVISIDEKSGELSFVHDEEIADALSVVGVINKERVTSIEPCNWLLRQAFRLIRNRVDDSSRWASFTRLWRCTWQARLLENDHIICTGRDREDLIRQEVEYLNQEKI